MNRNKVLRCVVLLLFSLHFVVFAVGQAQSVVPDHPDMVLVEGGSFIMGEQGGEYNPAHKVNVSSFNMARYEVTLSLWRQFTEEELPGFDWKYDEFTVLGGIREVEDDDPRPAYYMTWYEAIHFCNWLSEKRGLKPAYTLKKRLDAEWDLATGRVLRPEVEWNRKANGYRLPTEAEWEYAARGGRHSHGYSFAGSNNIDEVAWYWMDVNEVPGPLHPVGEKKPNELGLYDMSGNVSEFCWDYYDLSYYSKSPEKDPIGPKMGYIPAELVKNTDIDPNDVPYGRSLRGGDIYSSERWCRTVARTTARDYQSFLFGIRLVRNAP